ncbi:MAG: hypothetical protein LBR20_04840 [Propionibacteriaceae bacterium]|jgi:hypothetical protein|nr:hypothetical protein [Propionibacteriaceae bacterium]
MRFSAQHWALGAGLSEQLRDVVVQIARGARMIVEVLVHDDGPLVHQFERGVAVCLAEQSIDEAARPPV